jgi:hypothetical protein
MATFGGSNIVTDGLVLWLDAANRKSYPGSGTLWTDLSGRNNNVTLTNGPVFNQNNYGSISQDGTDDYFIRNDNSDFLFQGNVPITVDITIKRNTFSGFYPMILSCGDFDGTFIGGWWIFFYADVSNPNGVITFGRWTTTNVNVGSNGYAYTSLSDSANIDNWVFSYDTVNGTSLYRNGKFLSINSTTGSSTQRAAGAPPFYIGRRTSGAVTNVTFYTTRIYNRALTPSEVQQNYDALKSRYLNIY